MEARLIKDIQPKYNRDLQGRQNLPLPADHDSRGFSARRSHARAAERRREAVRPVRQRRQLARSDSGLAEDVQVSHLLAGHRGGRRPLAVVSTVPVGVASTNARRRAICESARKNTATTSNGCGCFWKATKEAAQRNAGRNGRGVGKPAVRESRPAARRDPHARKAGRTRRVRHARAARGVLRRSEKRPGRPAERSSSWRTRPRTIEGVDIAHLGGNETVASLVQFHRRPAVQARLSAISRFATWKASTTLRSIHEVVARRFQRLRDDGDVFPDMLLIDGGKGQLSAGDGGFRDAGNHAPNGHLARQAEEEVLSTHGRKASRSAQPPLLRPAAAAIRPRRSPPLRPALPPHPAAKKNAGRVKGHWSFRAKRVSLADPSLRSR